VKIMSDDLNCPNFNLNVMEDWLEKDYCEDSELIASVENKIN